MSGRRETGDERESERVGDDTRDRRSLTESGIELLILGALVVVLGVVAGIAGIVGGLLVAAFWYAFGVPFAIAAGHVVLVVVFPGELDLTTLLLVEGVFVALLLTVALESTGPARSVALTVSILAGFTLAASVAFVFEPIWVAAILLLSAIAVLSYGVHRYERALEELPAHGDERSQSTVREDTTAEDT